LGGRYKNYLLNLLMLILAFNYVDRLALGMVMQSVKADLNLSDTQLGILSGIAFALFYSIMGIPIARWADRGNRVTLISVTVALWSAAVAAYGAATSFFQLMLIRIGVAVGQAGCIPTAHSLIADHFPRDERPRALSRFMLGQPLGMSIGYVGAGWLNQLYGWHAMFFVLGVPGFVLAALVRFTLREPRHTSVMRSAATDPTPVRDEPSFREVVAILWANSTFRQLAFCFATWFFFVYGILQWQPAFFIRSHGIGTAELGIWMALASGGGGSLGAFLGGELAARYAAGNEQRQLGWSAGGFAVLAILNAYAYLAPNRLLAFTSLALCSVVGSMTLGPVFATIQTLVPERIRAMSVALLYLLGNLIGMGLGPLASGALSDALRPWLADESLRWALVVMSPGYLWPAWHLWRASRTVSHDLALAQVRVAS
jgi:MFS family permease